MGIESSRWANFFIVSLALFRGFSSHVFLPRCFENCQIDPKAGEDIIIFLRILFLTSDIRYRILSYPQARKSTWHGFQLNQSLWVLFMLRISFADTFKFEISRLWNSADKSVVFFIWVCYIHLTFFKKCKAHTKHRNDKKSLVFTNSKAAIFKCICIRERYT